MVLFGDRLAVRVLWDWKVRKPGGFQGMQYFPPLRAVAETVPVGREKKIVHIHVDELPPPVSLPKPLEEGLLLPVLCTSVALVVKQEAVLRHTFVGGNDARFASLLAVHLRHPDFVGV